jgi:hypothetical protein
MAYSDSAQWDDPLAAFTTGVCDPQDIMFKDDQFLTTPPPTSEEPPPRFILGQEVFILDSGGSELTGLTTYLILSNHEKDAAGRFLYRLMPSQEVVFRAAETRLLEVTFPLGVQVKRKKDLICSVVTRRYVVGGGRVYDLRNELGETVKAVKEEELRLSDRGKFDFITKLGRETGG